MRHANKNHKEDSSTEDVKSSKSKTTRREAAHHKTYRSRFEYNISWNDPLETGKGGRDFQRIEIDYNELLALLFALKNETKKQRGHHLDQISHFYTSARSKHKRRVSYLVRYLSGRSGKIIPLTRGITPLRN